MIRLGPATKTAIGLVLLTSSILVVGDFFGLVPNAQKGELEGRKKFSEALAVQLSMVANKDHQHLVHQTLAAVVDRNPDVVSAAIRAEDKNFYIEAGNHSEIREDVGDGKSTATQITVPMFRGEQRWGAVEVSFVPLIGRSFTGFWKDSIYGLVLFVALSGFFIYLLFIKRILRELDPAVVPERVQAAFNALAEGLLILDEKERIVLANKVFADKVGDPEAKLAGTKASKLPWEKHDLKGGLPWQQSLRTKEAKIGLPLKLRSRDRGLRTLMVNSTPIADKKGKIRGALVTFDDMTDMERKHTDLKSTLDQLVKSEEALRDKTVELEYLATRDSLTGCLNRRAFLESYEAAFTLAKRTGSYLMGVMVDIDRFKSINDRYGHTTGDRVLRMVADILRVNSRAGDLVGRYGGEEFCLVLTNTDHKQGLATIERLRQLIQKSYLEGSAYAVRVTASFGVAVLTDEISGSGELVNLADQALYWAKDGGRNRVVTWEKDVSGDGAMLGSTENVIQLPQVGQQTVNVKGNKRRTDERDRPGELQELRRRVGELEGELESTLRPPDFEGETEGYDDLTGLPNRMLFCDRIQQAVDRGPRYDQVVAIVSLDIDSFQRINDALGYSIGDQLLRKIAERLVGALRSADTVAAIGSSHLDEQQSGVSRLNNDEFGVLITNLDDVKQVTWVIKRMFEILSKRFEIDNHEIFITCSAGVSLYPHDSSDVELLLRHASLARNNAKSHVGNNHLEFYSTDINSVAYRQLWLESQLHRAAEEKEFSLNYQPMIDFDDGRICGMEVLLRWHHPKLGSIPPTEFIQIAEQTGLIDTMGDWVLQRACEQGRLWIDKGHTDIRIIVNLSAIQFHQADLADRILTIVEESGMPCTSLEFEITETTLMNNFEVAEKTIKRLHDAGIQFAIDDFGVGYSSLSSLKNLPVDTIKIDRSFLSNSLPNEQEKMIIEAIISMAHSLDLKVVAEGVETETQWRFLQSLDCDEFQGFLFSKPLSSEDATELLVLESTGQTAIG